MLTIHQAAPNVRTAKRNVKNEWERRINRMTNQIPPHLKVKALPWLSQQANQYRLDQDYAAVKIFFQSVRKKRVLISAKNYLHPLHLHHVIKTPHQVHLASQMNHLQQRGMIT